MVRGMRFYRVGKVTLLLAVLLLFGMQEAGAQSAVGAHLGTNFSGAFIGAQLRLGGGSLQLAPSADVSIAKGQDRWQLSGDVIYRLKGERAAYRPYLGAGLTVLETSGGGDTKVGGNALGGVELGLGFLRPFVQARASIVGNVKMDLMAGLLVRI